MVQSQPGWRFHELARKLPAWTASLPLLGLGCLPLQPTAGVERVPEAPRAVRAADPDAPRPDSDPDEPADAAAEPEPIPGPPLVEEAAASARIVPISLDTVLRLAEEQNPQIAIARARLEEACAERDVAAFRWLPDLWVGSAFYRHENGIQDFDGTLIRSSTGALYAGPELAGRFDLKELAYERVTAERNAWQQKGELARITSETLLDAANTYIDLLAARSGEAVGRNLVTEIEGLLQRTQKLAEVEPGLRVEVARIQAELVNRRQTVLRLQSQARAASAKLVYLLGLEPCVELVPVDERLVPFELVNVDVEACQLAARVLSAGPGIRELEGLVALVHDSMEKANSPLKYLPTVEFKALEGGFGGGPGGALTWDNRFDLGLQVRWNLTEFVAVKQRRRITLARLQQLHLTRDDLRRKLIVGVYEAHASAHSSRQQISQGEEQLGYAKQTYDLSYERFQKNLPGSTPSEVLLSIQGMGLAQLNYISAIRDYDRDQLRLLILLGPDGCASGQCLPAVSPE